MTLLKKDLQNLIVRTRPKERGIRPRLRNELGLLGKTKALSTVSGGSWATVPFTYLPDNISDEEFLGGYVDNPGELTLNDQPLPTSLNYVSEHNLGTIAARKSMSVTSLGKQAILRKGLGVPYSQIWTRLIGDNVLKRVCSPICVNFS